MDGHVPAATGPLSLGACIGPMARRVVDLGLLFRAIAEPTQFEIRESDSGEHGIEALRELSVAWYADDEVAPVANEIRDAVECAAKALADSGLRVDEAKPPGVSQGSRLWVELFSGAARNNIREFYRGKESEAGRLVTTLLRKFDEASTAPEQKIRIAERLANAVLEREQRREELLRWMKTTPIIIAPVGATCAFEHGARRVNVNGESISVFRAFSYSQTFNVFGLPSVAVPVGRSVEGLPIGVQVIGQPFEERTVLAVAQIIEEALGGWQPALSFF